VDLKIYRAKKNFKRCEEGFALITAIMFLAILTLIAVAASTTTNTELRVTTNIRAHHNAFYTAESGLSYIIATPALYGSLNIDPNTPATGTGSVGGHDFNVSAEYLGGDSSGRALRGSGYSAGKFQAHSYKLTSNGNGPVSATSELQAEGYRIGF